MKFLHTHAGILLTLLLLQGCHPKSDNPPTPVPPDPPTKEIPNGFSWEPQRPSSTALLTIYFKAPLGSPLYGYKGDVYLHTGVIEDDTWRYVPAEWDQNIPKCRMTLLTPNTWKLTMDPSPRSFFGVPEGEVMPRIGLVVRSADRRLKGQEKDAFITLPGEQIHHNATKSEPLPDGMQLGINIGQKSVTFVLDDRDKDGKGYDYGYVVGSFNGWRRSADFQMKRCPNTGYLWFTLSSLKPSEEYRMQYLLYGHDRVVRTTDPYATLVRWDVAGSKGASAAFTLSTDPYHWQHTDDFKAPPSEKLLIYELHLRDFSPEGNLSGATKRLEHIQSMGFNAIELMPIQEFDGDDSWGYNPCFHFALDQSYGSNEDYKAFIDECHRLGLAVIPDVVYNHATANSPFAQLYWDAAQNRPLPTNPWMTPQAPHPFSVFHDFNHSSPRVRQMVCRNLDYLIREYRVDGFRFDLSKGFTQRVSSDDSHFRQYDPDRIATLKRYHEQIKESAHGRTLYTILEHFAEEKEERELHSLGMLTWHNVQAPLKQVAMGYSDGADLARLWAPGGVAYMESHDEERLGYLQLQYAPDVIKKDPEARYRRLELAAAYLLLSPGPRLVWQYQEIGYSTSIDHNGRTGRKPVPTSSDLRSGRSHELAQAYSSLIAARSKYLGSGSVTIDYHSSPTWSDLSVLTVKSPKGTLRVVGNMNTSTSLKYAVPQGSHFKDIRTERAFVRDTLLTPGAYMILHQP